MSLGIEELGALLGSDGQISEDVYETAKDMAKLQLIKDMRSRYNRYALQNYLRTMSRLERMHGDNGLDMDVLLAIASKMKKESKDDSPKKS